MWKNQKYTKLLFCLWLLCTVERTSLSSFFYTLTIKYTTDNMITYTWKILYTTSTNHNNRVFLQVVPFTSDIGDNFVSICKTNLCNLSESRVWLLWSWCIYLETYSSSLWSCKRAHLFCKRIFVELKSWRLTLARLVFALWANELANCRHKGNNLIDE